MSLPSNKLSNRITNLTNILVGYAKKKHTLTYKEFAEEYNNKGYEKDITMHELFYATNSSMDIHGETRLAYLLEMINDRIENEVNEDILLSSIVINEKDGIPGTGFDGFISTRANITKNKLDKLKENKYLWTVIIAGLQKQVFDFYHQQKMN